MTRSAKQAKQAAASRKTKRRPGLAARADRHDLYEQAVQDVASECAFVEETFRSLRDRRAHRLREDFCGSASLCCQWARERDDRQAIGVDIDPEVLDWGRAQRLAKLPDEAAQRVELIEGDVREVMTEPVDVVLAMNFSYWLFKTRTELRDYFDRVRETLVDDGILFLDAYGGYEAFEELTEERECDGFSYIWDQARYDPITGDLVCHIHFRFPDGSELKRAFSYEWRLWTLPEIREMLSDAGFSRVTVHWQGFDADGEPDGNFKPTERGTADAGWICYLTAEK